MAKQKHRHYLREWRKHRGISQDELAKKLGITHGMISRYETSQSHMAINIMLKLFDILDVTPGEFFRAPDDPDAAALVDGMRRADTRAQAIAYLRRIVAREEAEREEAKKERAQAPKT